MPSSSAGRPSRRGSPGRPRRRAQRPAQTVTVLGTALLVLFLVAFVAVSSFAQRVVPNRAVAIPSELRVPLVSVRRAPLLLANETRVARVSNGLASVESAIPATSCLTVSWLGRQVAAVNPSSPFMPGSVVKLFTALAALKTLGDSYTFTTEVRGEVSDGVVQGDLVFVGGGDPLLVRRDYVSTERYPTTSPTFLESLADSIVAAGVKSVLGTIVVDDSRYDSERFPPSWSPDIRGVEGGPIGALVSSDGSALGQAVKPDNPAIAAGRDLRSLLRLRGVAVGDSVVVATGESSLPLIASATSAPLTSVVSEMLMNSDNNTAEMLTKELSFFTKTGGTTEAGVKIIADVATKAGIPMEGVSIVDGSGLSRENTLTCAAVQSLLLSEASVLPPLMSVAGESGTLRDVFFSHAIKGKMRAKTGTLSGVKSLAGYVVLSGADSPTFSLVMNREGIDNTKVFRPIWFELADALNRAKPNPTVDELAP